MFEITVNHGKAEYTSFLFSGGEIQVRLTDKMYWGHNYEIEIEAWITSANEIIELLMLVDALRRVSPNCTISLTCPYLPYARQDRVCEPGEALGLKVMCDLINAMKFHSVTLWDVHSDVAVSLLERARNIPQWAFVSAIPGLENRNRRIHFVAPDAGAMKKTIEASKNIGYPMVRADKVRSTVDGSITGTTAYTDHIGNADFLVIDDICDGGRTFIELAKVLRPLTDGRLFLYVTHAIFSKGVEPLFEHYDQIYTANLWPQFHEYAANYPDKLTIVRY